MEARPYADDFIGAMPTPRWPAWLDPARLMLVSGGLRYADVFATLEALGARLGRAVNPTILSGKDLAKRVKGDNAFVKRVLSQPKIWLIGGEDDLRV